MAVPCKPMPTRDHLERLWHDPDWSIRNIARLFKVSETLVSGWAKRYGFPYKTWRRPVVCVQRPKEYFDNSIEPVLDGPLPGDPTPEQIAEMTAYCRARRVMAGEACYVFIELPVEDEAWAA